LGRRKRTRLNSSVPEDLKLKLLSRKETEEIRTHAIRPGYWYLVFHQVPFKGPRQSGGRVCEERGRKRKRISSHSSRSSLDLPTTFRTHPPIRFFPASSTRASAFPWVSKAATLSYLFDGREGGKRRGLISHQVELNDLLPAFYCCLLLLPRPYLPLGNPEDVPLVRLSADDVVKHPGLLEEGRKQKGQQGRVEGRARGDGRPRIEGRERACLDGLSSSDNESSRELVGLSGKSGNLRTSERKEDGRKESELGGRREGRSRTGR